MSVRCHRAITALAVVVALAQPIHAQTVTTHSWSGTELISAYRVYRDGIRSNHLARSKAFPGLEFGGLEYLVTTFDFVNPHAAAAGFLVGRVGSSGFPFGNTHLVAYLGGINLLDLSEHYLGDSGVSCIAWTGCSPDADFSVLVPANATVQVAAFRLAGGVGQGGSFEFTSAFAAPTTVVPEPATFALVASGLAVVAAVAAVRRRRPV